MDEITFLDIGILIIIVFFILKGYQKGLIKQTSVILGVLIALIVSVNYFQEFQQYLVPYFDLTPGMIQFISFAILFILTNLFIHLVGFVIKNILNILFLGPIDHLAGALLGLIKGGVFAYLIVLFLSQIPYNNVIDLLESSLVSNLLDLTPIIQENLQEFYGP